MDKFIEEPLKKYDLEYSQAFDEKCQSLLDELVDKANVDADANTKACDAYYAEEKKLQAVCKKLRRLKAFRTLLIIFAIISLFVPFVIIWGTGELSFLAIALPIAFIIISLLVIFLSLNPKIRGINATKESIQVKMENLKQTALSAIAPLFDYFDNDIPKRLIESVVPNFKMDDYFTLERYKDMVYNYGFMKSFADDESTINVTSGSFNDNSFAEISSLNQSMRDKVYVGSLTIHWTTVERGSDGKSRTQHHTQVLRAESVHPIPVYSYRNSLMYCNESAPDLTFSRGSSDIKDLSDRKIDRKVSKIGKKLEKKTKADLNDDDPTTNFTAMANTEFEALFGALDRDNEVQFRLLFTPLAQKNQIDFIRDDKHFGDDFYFRKYKKINNITSTHSQGFDFSGNPKNYFSFDIRVVKQQFMDYNKRFFKNLYFDFIPLLNIPLYQQNGGNPVEGQMDNTLGRFNCYEVESLANAMENEFAPQNAKTRSILKTRYEGSNADKDIYVVSAYAFDSVARVDYISKFGGDGRTHLVPVPWEEFIPISNDTIFEVRKKENSVEDSSWQVKLHGLIARIINR